MPNPFAAAIPILIPVKDPGPKDIKIQFIFLISKLLFSNDFFKIDIKNFEYVLFNIFDKFKTILLFFNIEIENFSVLVSKANIFIFITFKILYKKNS